MLKYVGQKQAPKMESFLDWHIDPVQRPLIDEFGHKIADVIGLLDNKMKLALLQQNSQEYKFLMQNLKQKIQEVESKKMVQNIRKEGKYKKNYAKDSSSINQPDQYQDLYQSIIQQDQKVDDSNATIRGLEQIIKESIEEVRQGVPANQSKFQDSLIVQNSKNLTGQINEQQNKNNFNQDEIIESNQIYQGQKIEQRDNSSQGSQEGRVKSENNNNSKKGKVKSRDNSEVIEENAIHSLSHIDQSDELEDNYNEQDSEKVLEELAHYNDNRPMKEIFEDVRDSHLEGGYSYQTTDKSIQIEQRLAGSRFNAFLNSYDNSKNYLEQYNLYYDPKKYFDLQKQMENFKINMEKANSYNNYIMQQSAQNYPKEESVVIANSVNNRYSQHSMNTMNQINQQSFPTFTNLINQSQQNQTEASYSTPSGNKSKSVFINNSVSILSTKQLQNNISQSFYANSYNPTEQSIYKQLLNKKPSNFQLQNAQQIQQVSFQEKLQNVRSKTNPLQDIGRQSLMMRKIDGESQYKISLQEIIKQKQKYFQEYLKNNSKHSSIDDEDDKGKILQNPFKITIDLKMMIHMISKDFISEEILNFCLNYFQKKNQLGQQDQHRLMYYKRLLILQTDFYFVLTYDVGSKRDNMDHNLMNLRLEQLNFDLVRPYYEMNGNIFENYDKILIPICFKIVNEGFNSITLEYQLVVADINEKILYLYVLNRENLISQDLQNNAVLINVLRWLEYEYQWVFMKNFDSNNWKVAKGLVQKTADTNLTGYYLIYLVSQIILGFNKCESITNSQIKYIKQNIAETLVKVSNDYSIDKQPITDFLKYPL